MSLHNLGDLITHEGLEWRIVRIVQSSSLHQPVEGVPYIIDEHYLELRTVHGEVGFFTLMSDKKPFLGQAHIIPGLPEMPWRKENTDE